MKAGIVTTWNERCGLAEYSANIVKHLPEVDWRIIGREDWSSLVEIAQECDLVHIMHHGGLMTWITPEMIRACGKTVITRQCIGPEEVFNAATVKTSHIKTQSRPATRPAAAEPGYRWVPHGIPVVNVADVRDVGFTRIGCAGIPFDGKGHWEAVQIADLAGVGVNLIMPVNPHTSQALAIHISDYCTDKGIDCWVFDKWVSEEQVVRILALNQVNVFYYTRHANGVSGAVRLGLAARKPVIVSRHPQFHDIIAEGAVNVADSIEHAASLLHTDLVTPDELVDRWGYDKTARMYYDIYKEVLGDN